MPKNKGYKNINTSSTKMVSGGCKCGCQMMTKSNHPDPIKNIKPKQVENKVKMKKPKGQKLNPY